MKTIAVAILALSGIAPVAQAHQIWLEQPSGKDAVIRFGEFGENLRETSPGLLDKFSKMKGELIEAKGVRTAAASKTATGYALPFRASAGQSIVAEDAAYPLSTFKQGERQVTNWYRPAARYITGFAAQQPKLALDLVPAGKAGEFTLYYQGKVLPKAKVVLATQSGWVKEAHTDEQGKVAFDMPWKGTYVAEASHADRTPGERPGAGGPEKYDGVNYVTSVTYVKAGGLAPIPAGPAAAPNK